ncbi:MAG: hypothetical protein RLZZ127_3015, partial [Planctomycetota bacterium]
GALAGPGGALAGLAATATGRALVDGPGLPARGLGAVANTVLGGGTFVLVGVLGPLPAVVRMLPGGRPAAAWLVRAGCRLILVSGPCLACRAPRTPPPPGRVLVGNHASRIDILAALALPGPPRAIMAKGWVFASPLLGAAARAGGMVAAGPEPDPRLVAEGLDLVVFPEGSRSRDGRVQRFHTGAAAWAGILGRPLHLLVQVGSWHALPPGRAWIRPGLRRVVLAEAPAREPGQGLRAWMAAVRSEVAAIADRERCTDLGHPLSRLDRWEACAHRGWRAAWAWWRSERRGRWRAALVVPEAHLEGSDRAGCIGAAIRQRRPWPAAATAPRLRLALDSAHPGDAHAWVLTTGDGPPGALRITGSDLVLIPPSGSTAPATSPRDAC